MKIINETSLSYETIGKIIDNIINDKKEDTNYIGKKELVLVRYGDKTIGVQIKYLKRYVEWKFWYE